MVEESRQHILVVDDEEINRETLEALLGDDYDITMCRNGASALAAARAAEAPDLILLDVVMPDMDGHAVLQALRADPATRDIPVIFITGLDSETAEEHGLALGAVDYIAKPFRPAIVQARVHNHMARLAQYRELARTHDELHLANQQILESLRYARRIQYATLPERERIEGHLADIEIWWEPLHEVGGDYVWVEHLDGKMLFIMADCTGHGVPGAFMTLIIAASLDRLVHDRGLRRPAEILVGLDEMVRTYLRQDRDQADTDHGLEAAACLWDPACGTLTVASAGLTLLHGTRGDIRELRGERVSLGDGSRPRITWLPEQELRPLPGGAVYLFTDGLVHQVGEATGRLFGRGRLREALAKIADQPLAEQVAHLRHTLAEYRGSEPRRDDITLLAWRPL